ncbi:MAG: glutathione S-transferase family protein, partial [Candidatus Omnitrophica bacterium]|nr:glutathione S-transferase family protein [Candidatus Omnitrophota bacterium]
FLPVVDRQMSKAEYFAGEQFSLADVALLATMDPAEVASVNLMSYEHLTRWRNELQKKDLYTRCHASYAEALKKLMSR